MYQAWLMLARIKVKQGSVKEAIAFLKKAVENGLDKKVIDNDSTFDMLKQETAYKKLMGG